MPLEHRDHLQRLVARLPEPVRPGVFWLLDPGRRCLRLPLSLALILGGMFGFLPILGFWMVPAGALLLAQDVPILRPPVARAIEALERWWERSADRIRRALRKRQAS
jgi:hypothetical protein